MQNTVFIDLPEYFSFKATVYSHGWCELLGRYDGLALDSWLRSQFYKNRNNEKPCPDKKIEKHYKNFGEWRGLVIWCDMTEKWIN